MSGGEELRAAEQMRAGAATPVVQTGGAPGGALTLGQRLRAERERQGMSAAKAADSIHLDAWAIDALESGDYARLGPAVYVKGHLKRYADVLRLPSADIVAAFDPRASEAPPTDQPGNSLRMPSAQSRERDLPWAQIAVAIVLLLMVAGVVWWKPWHARAPAAALTKAAGAPRATGADSDASAGHAQPPGPATAAALPSATPSSATPPSAVASVAGSPAAALRSAAPATALAAARPAAADTDSSAGLGRVRLRLTFMNESWIDVHDAAGRRVFAGNCPAHSVRTLTGTAPLRIHLGAAAGVQMDVNSRPVSIPAQFIAHNAADFAAGADGVVRALPPGSSSAAHPRG